jgi:hypothetical protein
LVIHSTLWDSKHGFQGVSKLGPGRVLLSLLRGTTIVAVTVSKVKAAKLELIRQ